MPFSKKLEHERIITYDTKNIKKDNHDIIEEFSTKYSKMKHDYQKVTWGSKLEANGNYIIGAKQIDWSNTKTWLDLGCGVGNFFEYVFDYKKIKTEDFTDIRGIDPVPEFIDICKNKESLNGIHFEIGNVVTYTTEVQYDLVTSLGLLQLLDVNDVETIIEKMLMMVKPGGQIFLTTLNFDFKWHKRRRVTWSCWTYKKEEMLYLFGERHGCKVVTCEPVDNHGIISGIEDNSKIFVHAIKA